jgi:hypothetical protein
MSTNGAIFITPTVGVFFLKIDWRFDRKGIEIPAIRQVLDKKHETSTDNYVTMHDPILFPPSPHWGSHRSLTSQSTLQILFFSQ